MDCIIAPQDAWTPSEADLFVPLQRVRLTGEILRRMGAEVDERIYPGMGHLVNQDELEAVGGFNETIG